MADQIVFFQRKDHVKEGSSHTINVSFRARATAALSVPTSIKYKITDVSGYVVLDWTSVSAASAITLSITAAQNALRCQSNAYEVREVAVKADDGLSTQLVDTVCYRVENIAAYG